MVVHLLHPDVLPRKDLAQIDLAALVADPAAVRDRARPVVQRVGQRGDAGVRACRAALQLAGHAHPERLMRPLLVELRQEGVEAGLLLQRVGHGGLA